MTALKPSWDQVQSLDWAIAVVAQFDAAEVAIPTGAADLVPYVDVLLWARSRTVLISADAICARWGVSRATAYRWLKLLRAQQAAAS